MTPFALFVIPLYCPYFLKLILKLQRDFIRILVVEVILLRCTSQRLNVYLQVKLMNIKDDGIDIFGLAHYVLISIALEYVRDLFRFAGIIYLVDRK